MSEQTPHNTVFVQVVDRPARKLILKRGQTATHYFAYCEEGDGEGFMHWGLRFRG